MQEIEIKRLYGALRSELNNLSVQDIRNTAGAAGIDITRIPSTSEARTGLGSRAEVMPAIDKLFGELPMTDKLVSLRILAEKLTGRNTALADNVQEILGRHGFRFILGKFIPIGILDAREEQFLPKTSAAEIARAMARLIDGDESGAITAACGAVDIATQQVYQEYALGDPGRVSFSAKVNTALKELKIFEKLKTQYVNMGMSEADASDTINNIRQATNFAAQALQVLRKTMGDVHGAKPALRETAFDSIKWASAICGLFGKSI